MSLESGDYINDLVITNPASSDAKSFGDDHFRLVKKVLKECLNGFTGGILLTATESGTAAAHVLSPTTALVGYTTGLMLLYRPSNAGTGPLTVNVSALGAKSVKTIAGADPTSGDILANQPVLLMYDGTNFVILAGSEYLSKTGNQTFTGNLTLTGNQTVSGTLAVTGATTFTGDIGGTGGDKKANKAAETYGAGAHDFTAGTLTAATAAAATNTTVVATTAHVFAERTNTATLTNKTLTSPTLTTPTLGTPASGVLTNCTGTAPGLTAGNVTTNANLTGHVTSVGNAAVLGSFTSAQLAAALTDETGSGVAVFGTSPTIASPTLTGTPAAPTATLGTNTTQVATTAFVQAAAFSTAFTGTLAQLNAAVTDADVASLAGSETLTNKTLTTPVLSNPSYSGTTSNGGTVTTIDINGGTIDGTGIGWDTPAAVSATTLSATGTSSLANTVFVTPSATGTNTNYLLGRLYDSRTRTVGNAQSITFENNTTDQLARIQVTDLGGAGNAQGQLEIKINSSAEGVHPSTRVLFSSSGLAVTGILTPEADNTRTLGTSALRWSTVYAGTGTINTSDAREKTSITALSAAEINAAKQLAKEVGVYKFLASIQTKGASARSHIGLTVQRAIEVMEINGLAPFAYGFICFDAWEDKFIEHPSIEAVEAVAAVEAKEAVLDADGAILEPAIEAVAAVEAVEAVAAWTEQTQVAGDRYAFRYDQLNLFIAAGFEARLAALEAA